MDLTWRIAAAMVAVTLACVGCATSGPGLAAPSVTRSSSAAAAGGALSPALGDSGGASSASGDSPGASQTPAALPLAGKTVGIDPGHNGGNFDDSAFINNMIWNGRAEETCDTTGTQTATGYTEAQFNFNVATYLRADLIADGARVVLTRHSNHGVGPCVTSRAQIINRAHADVAIDIHADGGPSYGRGFTVLEPVADGPNDKVISASIAFGNKVRAAMLAYTRMPVSDYYGQGGIIERDDLAGLNLTTVPKILIECGNMPNATDARLLTSPAFQHLLARALTASIVAYLTGRPIKAG
ncbi:MAG TPA: N-acetylmuramoyl-L-alanine amidase [Streptosporangiaceae bacterium]|jgi:N-acetylmuramoyl-L-alanine amidase